MASEKYWYDFSYLISSSSANVLEKILYKENIHDIRVQGLELLLLFLEDLETPDPPQTNILASAIDLEVFKWKYAKKITLKHKTCSSKEVY